MKNKLILFLLSLIFIFCFIIFYQSLKKPNLYSPSVTLKKQIPYFKSRTLILNKKIDSQEIFKSGNYYLFNIWSSWCVPCRDEHSILMELSQNNSLEIIGLNYKDKTSNAKKFLEELGNPFSQVIIDRNGLIAIEWGAYGVPESFLINDQKKIIKKFLGPLNSKILKEIKVYLK